MMRSILRFCGALLSAAASTRHLTRGLRKHLGNLVYSHFPTLPQPVKAYCPVRVGRPSPFMVALAHVR